MKSKDTSPQLDAKAEERRRYLNKRLRERMDAKADAHPNAPKGFIPIPNYEGRYSISQNGEVFSHYSNKLLVLVPDSGYAVVSLGSKNRSFVHWLVAAAFLGPRPRGLEIDHINRVRSDNHCDNLRYVTHSDNKHNVPKHPPRTKTPSKYKGVYRICNKRGIAWRSQIVVMGKYKYIGVFKNEKSAAIAFDEAAILYRGDNATTNKMLGLL